MWSRVSRDYPCVILPQSRAIPPKHVGSFSRHRVSGERHMRRAILGAAVAACFSTGALGFVPKDATYYCAAEISAGLSFDKSSKKWAGMKFGTNEKFYFANEVFELA